MFTLRQQHIEAFNKDIRCRFEERMVAHVNQFFPVRCQVLGAEGVREWISHGIGRAQSYSIVAERDVLKYINIMFVFGRDFDVDPEHRWAAAILTARSVDPTHKTTYLYKTARHKAMTMERLNG
jgi:hypothetical protein